MPSSIHTVSTDSATTIQNRVLLIRPIEARQPSPRTTRPLSAGVSGASWMIEARGRSSWRGAAEVLANLNSEVASGNLTFFFEDTSTTTYAIFTCEGTAVAGYSACIDVRNFCPLLGMVYSAKQVASKLNDRYVLSPRAGAMRRLQNQAWVCQAWVCTGLARRFSA